MTDEPKTDKEKIRWLWKARDADNQTIEDLRTTSAILREENIRYKEEVRTLRARLNEAQVQVGILGVEVNEARAAAADAVQNYRASVGDG